MSIDQLPEVIRRNPKDIRDGWIFGNSEIYPQFDEKSYYPRTFYLLQQSIIDRGWFFGVVSPSPYPPKTFFVTVYKLENKYRTYEAAGTSTELCLALMVAYVEALKVAGIIKGSGV